MKILAVDDNEHIREILSEMLSRFGFECSTAANGREALDLMQRENFTLVLSDMRMPEMGGIELLHEIKKNYPDTDVISVTGYDANYTFTDVIKAGARLLSSSRLQKMRLRPKSTESSESGN